MSVIAAPHVTAARPSAGAIRLRPTSATLAAPPSTVPRPRPALRSPAPAWPVMKTSWASSTNSTSMAPEMTMRTARRPTTRRVSALAARARSPPITSEATDSVCS